jgi:predicted acylesterase/phospholipase RssA
VDGGLLSNFPIELFLSNQPQVTDVMGEKTTDSSHVMGFLIDETMEVPGAPGKEEAPSGGFDFSKLRTVDRIKGLVNTMMQAHDKNVIETYSHLVIRLPAKSYGTIEFDMSDDRREALVNAGRSFTVAYFNQAVAAEFPEVLSAIGPADTPEMLEQADRIAESILFK